MEKLILPMMAWISNLISLLITISIYNVWILRFSKSTSWRGGGATNMKEEFSAYGLPEWLMYLAEGLKPLAAAALVLGIWYPQLSGPAAILIALQMGCAIVMHLKISDPLNKSLPAIIFLALSLFIFFT